MGGDIFIIDDNLSNLQLLEGILKEHNYKVRMANSGRRALVAVRTAPPELIMLDITMPEMSGYEVCHHLKSDPATADIPVIFISALDDVLDKVRAFNVGGVDYVGKPFQTEEVVARIENQLKISRLQKQMEEKNRELAEKNIQLDRMNKEFAKKNEELILSQKKTDLVFSALTDILPGSILDEKFRLDKKIGEGGFGAVYEATHLSMKRAVAVKIFRPAAGNCTADGLARFRLEAISACRVIHPNAVSVLDSGISVEGISYIVMELLNGHSLSDELHDKAPFSMKRSAEILIPVCDVLTKAHSAGIIHRDIKPDNIFLHQGEEGEVIKVVDFGIAKLLNEEISINMENLTGTNSLLGTPTYMAPERLQGSPYDGQSDVYSLGIILYYMLTGQLPFQAGDGGFYAIFIQHLTKDPIPLRSINPNISELMEAIVMQILRKEPQYRPTAQELGILLTDVMNLDISNSENNRSLNAQTEIKMDQTVVESHGNPLFIDKTVINRSNNE